MTFFSLRYKKFISHWPKQWRGVLSYNFSQRRECMLIHYSALKVTELACIFNRWKLWNTGVSIMKCLTANVSHFPNSPVWGRRLSDWNIEVGFSAIMVWFMWVCNSRFYMDVIIRAYNYPVSDMTALVSGLINENAWFLSAIPPKSS